MTLTLTPNTEVALLLTAPLIAPGNERSAELLSNGDYKKLSTFCRSRGHQPGDFLSTDSGELIRESEGVVGSERLKRLLDRSDQLDAASLGWESNSVWVFSSNDDGYPPKLNEALGQNSPILIYGCGDRSILDRGGLAVVGSRNVDNELIEYSENVGRLVAGFSRVLISGAARGIDQSAMRGALGSNGTVAGVMADSLGRSISNWENKEFLSNGRLVLISPYDPAAGFNVGNAMQRNKLIYALADAALAVSADHEKGGTWAGAVEQLDKLRLCPLYVRSTGDPQKSLQALERKGATPWPNPESEEAFAKILEADGDWPSINPSQSQFSFTEEIT
jgi:DNA processing protein